MTGLRMDRWGGLVFAAVFIASAAFMAAPVSRAAAGGGRFPAVLKDDSGTAVTVKAPARRIVSLIPSDTEILLALGLKSRIVGVDQDSLIYMPEPYHAEAKGLPSVGNTYDPGPNLEVIAKKRPDLILSSTAIAGTANTALRRLGVPVLVLEPATLSGIARDVELVGRAAGVAGRANRLVASMRTAVAALRAKAKRQAHHPTVFVELGDPGLYTAGPGSYIDGMLRALYAKNVVDAVSHSAYPQIDPETLLELDPQVIILDDTPEVTVASVANRPGFGDVAAVENHRVYGNIDPNLLSEPGPSIVQALRRMYADLYPPAKAMG